MENLISLQDLQKEDFERIFELTAKLKNKNKDILHGKTIAMLFEKPSTRTRISFEVATYQLGGHAIYMTPKETQIGRGETIADTARVLSRYVDGIVARVFAHNTLLELAKYSAVPVINALSDYNHPVQIIADIYTLIEKNIDLETAKIVWVGDGNNVCNSWINAAAKLNLQLIVSTPKDYKPDNGTFNRARAQNKQIQYEEDPYKAVRGADVIITDTWVSMGEEKEAKERERIFKRYQVNKELVGLANENYVFMHCLPAHRGQEVTNDIIDSDHSIVFDEAENRLHTEKAILTMLLG